MLNKSRCVWCNDILFGDYDICVNCFKEQKKLRRNVSRYRYNLDKMEKHAEDLKSIDNIYKYITCTECGRIGGNGCKRCVQPRKRLRKDKR